MQVYQFRRGKIAFSSIFLVLGFIGFSWAALYEQKSGTMALFAFLSLGSAFVLFLTARILLSNKPCLIVDEQGFQMPMSLIGSVPWTQVTALTRTKVKRTESLKISLDPTYARTLPRVGPASWFHRRPNNLGVVMSNLRGTPDEISAAANKFWNERRELAKSCGDAIAVTPTVAPATLAAAKPSDEPIATYALIALFFIVYFCELAFGVDGPKDFSPTVRTLAFLGGDLGTRITNSHEYWRMFTAPLMHAGPLHILFNSIAFWWAGSMVERIAGWKWMLGIFALTALAGEAASLMFLAHNIVGVGASGGVMGVLAAVLLLAGRLPEQSSTRIRTNAVQWLIPSLLPILLTSKDNVNYYAHAGGAVMGLILGYALLKLWKRDAPNPPFANVMAIGALGFFGVAAYAIIPIMHLLSLR